MVINEITVYLDEETAKKFVLFQKHFDVFNLMLERKVFEQKGATLLLHFDKFGQLRNISRQDVLYDYGSIFQNTNTKLSTSE